jgi:predicted O-methyltransferase YrrM
MTFKNVLVRLRLHNMIRNFLLLPSFIIEWIASFAMHYPPGHFYSPVPSTKEVREFSNSYFKNEVQGVNLNEEVQLVLLKQLSQYYDEMPFADGRKEGLRYYFKNGFFSYADGIILYSMLRHLKPRKIIEIGSGFSSSVMLDVNEKYSIGSNIKFIEPNPKRLNSLLHENDRAGVELWQTRLQDMDLGHFKALSAGDILFVDSSHVSKIGSDINFIFFEILPCLSSNVYIHIHDIFFPFEYPKEYVVDLGRAWNEAYMLRNFLSFNDSFEIVFFNDFLAKRHPEKVNDAFPLFMRQTGSSIWLRKK